MLRALHAIGFDLVIATPHMRPSLFDNERSDFERAWARMQPWLAGDALPRVGLGSEHFLDDVVYGRILAGSAMPYPGERSVLVEFPVRDFPVRVGERLHDLRIKKGLLPVLAHPERYAPVWDDISVLDDILDSGTALLMDVASLQGRYGRRPQRSAQLLLREGYYHAACSDAHRSSDVDYVARGIRRLEELAGADTMVELLCNGPRAILDGTLEI